MPRKDKKRKAQIVIYTITLQENQLITSDFKKLSLNLSHRYNLMKHIIWERTRRYRSPLERAMVSASHLPLLGFRPFLQPSMPIFNRGHDEIEARKLYIGSKDYIIMKIAIFEVAFYNWYSHNLSLHSRNLAKIFVSIKQKPYLYIKYVT